MDREELFCLKAAALLHRPPINAWILADKFDAQNFDFHGEAVEALSGTKLANVKKYLADGKVKVSESLAEGMDQWLLGKLADGSPDVFRVSEVKIKNIFNPSFSAEITPVPDPHILKEYLSSIKGVLGNVADVGLAYHLLYACYEPLWIIKDLPVVPADPRVPTCSVFDYSYATVSMMNWLFGSAERVDGILLFIDLAGVHKFISSSRKLRDLWISSYLVSALAWHLFWIFVKRLGPDVLLLPTCRDNQFYYHSLMAELRGNVDDKIMSQVKEIARKLTSYDTDRDMYPNFPVIPATGSLILPNIKVLKEFEEFKNINSLNDLEDYVISEYKKIWKELFNSVSNYCANPQDSDKDFLRYFHDLLEGCRKYGFDETPPLPIRVITLSTDKLHNLGAKYDDYNVYHYMFRLLQHEQWKKKLLRKRPEEKLLLFDMTSQPPKTWPEKSNRGFDYCTVCGYLPAIVIMPTDRKLKAEDKTKYEKMLEENKIRVENVRPIFGPGERLCPYCLIKRIVSLDGIREEVFSQLIGNVSEQPQRIIFPSVTDIAIAKFRETLVNKADRIKENDKLVESMVKKIDKLLGKLKSQEGKPLLKAEEKLLNQIRSLKNRELRQDLEVILSIDAEQTILRDRASVRDWTSFIHTINKETKQYRPDVAELQAYYALVSCDGDNMGKIITGCVKEAFGVSVKDYLCGVPEGDLKMVVENLFEGKVDEAIKLLDEKGVGNAGEKANELAGWMEKLNLDSRKDIFISPVYHASFSRALMRSAISDSKIVEEHFGLVVYAGGDDLLAVMPVDKSLEAVQKIRENFNLPSPIRGFYALNSSFFVPSLVSAGRSFSVYFAHYMFPLYSVVRSSDSLLEYSAKKTEWPGLKMEKDTLVLTYSPRGGGITAHLPLGPSLKTMSQEGKLAEAVGEIKSIQSEIDGDVFSISLLYDLENNLETIDRLIKSNSPLLVGKMLEYIFERNTPRKEDREAKRWSPYVQSLKENYNLTYILGSGARKGKYVDDFIKALNIYKSGVKGVAL